MSLVKKIVWSALLGISCLIIFLPQLLSTSFGSWCLTSYLQHRFAGHWNIDSIKVQWKGVQEIKGCQWSQQHHSKLYFSQLTLQGFLPQIIFGSSALQPLKLHDAIIMLDQKSSFDHSSLLSRIHTIELLNCDIYQQAQYLHIDSCHLDLNVHHLDLKATCHLLDQQGFIDIVYDAQDKLLQASLDQFKLSWIPFLKPYLVILGEEASGSILQTKSTLQADIRTTTCSINALAQQKEDSLIFDPIYIDCNYSTAHLQRYIPSVSIEQLQATIDIEHLIFSFKDPSKLQLIAHAFFPRIVLQHAHSTHIVEELSFHAQHQEQLLITYTTKDQKIKGHITSDKNQHQFKLPAHFVLSFLPIKHQLPQELSCDLMLELQGSYLTGSLELLSDVIVFKSHFTGDIHKPITLHYSLDYESIAIDGSCILHLQQACCISKITGTIHSALGHFWFEGHCDPSKPLHLNDTYFHLQGSLHSTHYQLIWSTHLQAGMNQAVSKVQLTDQNNWIPRRVLTADLHSKNLFEGTHFNPKNSESQVHIQLLDLPLQSLNPFLADLLGLHLHGTCSFLYSNHAIKEFALALNGKYFTVQTSTLDDLLNTKIHWSCTTARYRTLIQKISPFSSLTLMHPSSLDISIQHPFIPLTWEEFQHLPCQGSMFLGALRLFDPLSHNTVSLHHTTLSFNSQDLEELVSLQLSSDFSSSSLPVQDKQQLQASCNIIHLPTFLATQDPHKLTLQGQGAIDLLPVTPMLDVLPLQTHHKQILSSLLGEFLSISTTFDIQHLSGDLDVDVVSSNARCNLPFMIQEGIVTLRQDSLMFVHFTPDTSRKWLTELNPFLLEEVSSPLLIKLFIAAEGFKLPLYPFSYRDIDIEKIVVQIGKVDLQVKNNLLNLLELLQLDSKIQHLQAWFTPLFLSIHQGVLHSKRSDVLLGTDLHVAIWGDIDLMTTQVDMNLGIDTKALKNNSHLALLTKDEFFLIRIKGSTDNLQIDWTQAYTRMGTLAVRLAGGVIGYVVGGVLEQLLKLGVTIPAPTTQPFPWDQIETIEVEQMPIEATVTKPSWMKRLFQFLIP